MKRLIELILSAKRCFAHHGTVSFIGVLRILVVSAIPLTCLAAPNFDDLDQSVVRVINTTSTGMIMGTGFVINDQQNVVTNHHVVEGSRKLLVADGGMEEAHLKKAVIKWLSEKKDLAILHVPNLRRPALSLSSVEPGKGTQIYAIGFPGVADLLTEGVSIESSVTTGTVGRLIDAAWQENTPQFRVVQHSSEINGGNSGGPLVNSCGQVVGINTVKISLATSIASGEIISGVFYASHISSLMEVLKAQRISFNEIQTGCSPNGTAAAGEMNVRIIAIVAVVLALFAVLFSLRRPRQQVIQAVETCSQWVRHPKKVGAIPCGCSQSRHTTSRSGWVLSGLDRQGQSVHFTLQATGHFNLTIGRSSKLCDLVVKDDSISRCHARLSYSENSLSIEDLNSLNGTKVNGVVLKPFKAMRLISGNTLTLGLVELTVQS